MKTQIALALAACIALAACLTDEMKKDVAGGTYAAQQQSCIDRYGDKPHIDACRDEVKRKWSNDAGADAAQDGGT
jgi:hypothetical protein